MFIKDFEASTEKILGSIIFSSGIILKNTTTTKITGTLKKKVLKWFMLNLEEKLIKEIINNQMENVL